MSPTWGSGRVAVPRGTSRRAQEVGGWRCLAKSKGPPTPRQVPSGWGSGAGIRRTLRGVHDGQVRVAARQSEQLICGSNAPSRGGSGRAAVPRGRAKRGRVLGGWRCLAGSEGHLSPRRVSFRLGRQCGDQTDPGGGARRRGERGGSTRRAVDNAEAMRLDVGRPCSSTWERAEGAGPSVVGDGLRGLRPTNSTPSFPPAGAAVRGLDGPWRGARRRGESGSTRRAADNAEAMRLHVGEWPRCSSTWTSRRAQGVGGWRCLAGPENHQLHAEFPSGWGGRAGIRRTPAGVRDDEVREAARQGEQLIMRKQYAFTWGGRAAVPRGNEQRGAGPLGGWRCLAGPENHQLHAEFPPGCGGGCGDQTDPGGVHDDEGEVARQGEQLIVRKQCASRGGVAALQFHVDEQKEAGPSVVGDALRGPKAHQLRAEFSLRAAATVAEIRRTLSGAQRRGGGDSTKRAASNLANVPHVGDWPRCGSRGTSRRRQGPRWLATTCGARGPH
jgi:hypothetical protein